MVIKRVVISKGGKPPVKAETPAPVTPGTLRATIRDTVIQAAPDVDDGRKVPSIAEQPARHLRVNSEAVAAHAAKVAVSPLNASNMVLSAKVAADGFVSRGDVAQQAGAVAISAALVADLTARAERAAAMALPSASDQQASLVWSDVLSILDADGLSPRIYCARSGRDLGAIDPTPWRDHLAVIQSLGTSRAADGALVRLVSAIHAQKGHTVAPPLLVQSTDALALLRELHPVDYVMTGLSRLVASAPGKGPMAQSMALAVRADLLGKMRGDASALPRPVLEYLAECLTMYLSHVTPDRVPMRHNAVAFYDVERWASALVSPASVSHLCNRLVLTLWNLIQARRLRPAAHITLSDLRALNVHWGGLGEYQGQRAARRVVRSMTSGNRSAALGADPETGKGGVRYDAGQVAGLGDAVLGFDLADALDLQSALRMTGRKVPIAVHSVQDHERLTQRRAAIERIARDIFSEDDDTAPDITIDFGLSEIAASGQLGDMLSPEYADAAALLDAGLIDDDNASDLFALMYDEEGDEVPDDEEVPTVDPDEEGDEDDTLAAFGLGDAARDMLRGAGPSMSRASVSEIQAAALERAITQARPLGKLRPRR